MNLGYGTVHPGTRESGYIPAVRLGVLCAVLLTAFLMVSAADASEEVDAEIILEGDLTETARFYLTDDYRLYFEGTGPVACDTALWADYYYLITELHVSDGITSVENKDLSHYYGLEAIYLGRDLETFNTDAVVDRLVFENGCGDIKSISCWFQGGNVWIQEDATGLLKDGYAEIRLDCIPSSDVPDECIDFVGFGSVYRLQIGDLDEFEGTVKIRLLYGDPEASFSVHHLLPTYGVDCEVGYTTDFYCNQTGYYVVKNETDPLIPYAKELAAVLAAAITLSAIVYYRRVTRRVEEDG
jgi:hypothetical protein